MEDKKVLIVGGGSDGLHAAVEQADSGAQVTILEKFPTLGSQRIPRDRLIKPGEPFPNPDAGKVRNHPNIEFLPFSEIKKIGRDNGRVQARILKRSLRVDNSNAPTARIVSRSAPSICSMILTKDSASGRP